MIEGFIEPTKHVYLVPKTRSKDYNIPTAGYYPFFTIMKLLLPGTYSLCVLDQIYHWSHRSTHSHMLSLPLVKHCKGILISTNLNHH